MLSDTRWGLADLHKAAILGKDRVYENALAGCLAGLRVRDYRGLLTLSESEMWERAEWVVDWMRDVLGLHYGVWPGHLRRLLLTLQKGFHHPCGVAPAFVFVESCRDRVVVQNSTLVQTPLGRPSPAVPVTRHFRLDGLDVPTRGLRFASKFRTRVAGERVVRYESVRTLRGPAGVFSQPFVTWCLADPDDEPALARCWVPAGSLGDCEIGRGVNAGRLVTWVKCDGHSGRTVGLAVDIHPSSGEVLSVRRTRIPLAMYRSMHPRLDGYLAEITEVGLEPDEACR